MGFTTVGSLIKEIRTAKNVTRKALSYGICSEHALRELEEDRYAADVLMLDVLLQRLGQSPDKFEMVLSSENYNMVRLRDLIAETIYRKKRKLAKLLLQNYPSRTHIDAMYQHRMRALLTYRMNGDCACVAEHLQKAIAATLPDFTYERFYAQMNQYLISAVELENLLALERMNLEGNPNNINIRSISKCHLELCMDYIGKHFDGDEEYDKLVSKCAWLTGGICYLEKDYMQAISLCKKGIEGLRRNTILYFMLPLLDLIIKSETALGIPSERSKWVQYHEILTFLWKGYAKKWYPTDALFHNCYQRDYHLDYELIQAERKSQHLTQEQLAEDIYQNTESLSRVETGKVSPNKKNFEKLMDKLGLEKRTYNGCVVTNSFAVMELKRNIDGFMMRRDFQKAKEATERLKNALDLEISENKMVVGLYELINAKRLGEMTAEETLKGFKKLSERFMDIDQKTFSHIPMRNETLVINNICVTLCETGNVTDAVELYRITLEKIKSSKVKIKYRYRSYQILFNNYVHECGNIENSLEELQTEFLCGKTSEFPFCLNNILQILNRNDIPNDELDTWAKAIYYMCDLNYLDIDKRKYQEFLINKRNIKVID